ncbi:hypothetical protein [Pontibacter roseus]|uniref:hypothetical protein n=1 Tax=Pontibacter roseus TaxID=336989 RepID=UPI00037DDC4C|nr:hypothetical protein [Pontibacter roseus]
MNKVYLTLLSCLLLAMAGCQGSGNAKEMLQDEEKRTQVYTAILEDEQLREEMMARMRDYNMGGPGSRGQMQGRGMAGDTAGMAAMNRQQMQVHLQQLTTLCATDTAACSMLSDMMLDNRAIMGHLMQRMQRRGSMDSGCLQMMMRQLER